MDNITILPPIKGCKISREIAATCFFVDILPPLIATQLYSYAVVFFGNVVFFWQFFLSPPIKIEQCGPKSYHTTTLTSNTFF